MRAQENINIPGSDQNLQVSQHQFYQELTSRNHHFIPKSLQEKIKNLKIAIAGCGSTGGACIEPLARLGLMNFELADNGDYEISNLNRQHARLSAMGVNKAIFHKGEVLNINPFSKIIVHTQGITKDNVDQIISNNHIIFDAVDVTTPEGMQAKILLHEVAFKEKKPVLSALDLGFCQYGKSFDYRRPLKSPLNVELEYLKNIKNPIKALFTIYPLEAVPNHCLTMIDEILTGKSTFASQLGCTSDMLGSIIVPVILRFANSGELTPGWCIDTYAQYKRGALSIHSLKSHLNHWKMRRSLKKLISEVS